MITIELDAGDPLEHFEKILGGCRSHNQLRHSWFAGPSYSTSFITGFFPDRLALVTLGEGPSPTPEDAAAEPDEINRMLSQLRLRSEAPITSSFSGLILLPDPARQVENLAAWQMLNVMIAPANRRSPLRKLMEQGIYDLSATYHQIFHALLISVYLPGANNAPEQLRQTLDTWEPIAADLLASHNHLRMQLKSFSRLHRLHALAPYQIIEPGITPDEVLVRAGALTLSEMKEEWLGARRIEVKNNDPAQVD